ncbi:hypothetical protein BP6252_11668 [Coleophoma cylindrospora]|uniref:Tyrosine specific protein phosphatases domain-containing protein n=1 Tax=Coleophoma cylindrospora TaxID=1849047 RepID=A0A3D8QK98_9HELO|nr:hypothetical protein BP6252_11668 [Coleophoma cylindrospora]
MSVIPETEGTLPSPPFIEVAGIPNFRDLGGYPISSSPRHSVRRDIIYRSAEPQRVTKDGIATMNSLGITHIYDLRSKNEIERNKAAGRGGVVTWEGCERLFAPVFADEDYSPEKIAIRFQDYAAEGTEGFTRAYDSILQTGARTSYRTILLHLANEPTKPMIIHCTAGKDRTGVICALVLSLCGVDDETVAREYSLTELGLPEKWKVEVIKHLMDNPDSKLTLSGARNLISARQVQILHIR